MAISVTMLICAETGLAGALAPMPTRKPFSVSAETLLQAAPEAFAVSHPSIPMPPVKPERTGGVASLPDLALRDMADAAARDLAAIEPAAFTTGVRKVVPTPTRKPALAEPDIRRRLNFETLKSGTPGASSYTTEALSDQDAALYQFIFAAQGAGNWSDADRALTQLKDQRLRGHILFQRYMHPGYKASFAELESWMDHYADHPGADRLHRLAASRKPAGFSGTLQKPENQIGLGAGTLHTQNATKVYAPDKKRNPTQRNEVTRLIKAVNAEITRGAPTRALRRLNSDPAAKIMDTAEYDQLRGQIANGYLLMGKPAEARALALASARRSGSKAPMAGWAGGLAAWMQKDYREAAIMFGYTAKSPYVSGWMRAAGAYWASRAHMRSGNMKEVTLWLKEAASHPRTFYGMIATRSLGWDFYFDWSSPDFTKAHFNTLVAIPSAWRAMALVQAGQNHLAEAELLQIDPDENVAAREALLAYTHVAHLPSLSMRLANNFKRPDGGLYDAALYPLLPWEPRGGYTVDRALIHAIARQESKFDTSAKSSSGAMGLMQVLPTTAGYIMESRNFGEKSGRHHLSDPQINLEVGQKYVDHLLEQDEVEKDLLSLAIAYNAGPGNLRKWRREVAIDDPLLFIEMIPMAETRNYVERVMANYWIYAIRMGQSVPTLDLVVEGKQASYVPLDDKGATIRLTQVIRPFRLASN